MICPKCKESMKCIVTGATITTYTKYSTNGPYEKWQCDYFECQHCGNKLYTGFGAKPFESGDDSVIEYLKEDCERLRRELDDCNGVIR